MGTYTDNLHRRRREQKAKSKSERLMYAALTRDGAVSACAVRSHAEVRKYLGDEDPYLSKPGDIEGFLTSAGRFVDRDEARIVGADAGQFRYMHRKLLSSDIDW